MLLNEQHKCHQALQLSRHDFKKMLHRHQYILPQIKYALFYFFKKLPYNHCQTKTRFPNI